MKKVRKGIWRVSKLLMRVLIGMMASVLLLFLPVSTFAEEEGPSVMTLVEQMGYEVYEVDRPESAILIDANTGKYLWGENPDLPRNPASIMKLMTLYLVYEAIENGQFTLDTTVTGDIRYQAMSQIYALSNAPIIAGVEYPVRELLPMVLVPSSNVATIMLAELVEKDPVAFLAKMNETAQRLGMTNTTIYNATGAGIGAFEGLYVPNGYDGSTLQFEKDNETTARDIAILVYHLLNQYPEILEYTQTSQVTAMQGTPYEETYDTYNHSLPGMQYEYAGVDGLKTGSSMSGGYNIAMTGQREELRLITIVLGVAEWGDPAGEYKRHPFANAILDYGFQNFAYRELLKPGEQEINDQKFQLEQGFFDLVRNDSQAEFQLNETTLSLKNSLPTVSEKIGGRKQEVQLLSKRGKPLPKEPTKPANHLVIQTIVTKGFQKIQWLVLLILGLIVLLVGLFLLQTNSKRKRARRNRGRRFDKK